LVTEQFTQLLSRDFARISVEPLSAIMHPLLNELVNHALWAFRRSESETPRIGGGDEHLPSLLLYRHTIEMADGIDVLIQQSCGTASIPVLRSEFEATSRWRTC
jgi:hypothetical protein